MVPLAPQDGQQAGDREGVPARGAEVAPGQLPGCGEEAGGEEVHRHRGRQGGAHGRRQARAVRRRRRPPGP